MIGEPDYVNWPVERFVPTSNRAMLANGEGGTLPALQVECEQCGGDGRRARADGTHGTCPTCGGQGYFPTVFGEEVLDLVRRNLWKVTGEA